MAKKKRVKPIDKLVAALEGKGLAGKPITTVDKNRNLTYSMYLNTGDGEPALVGLELIEKDDGTFRIKTVPSAWLKEQIAQSGFIETVRKRQWKQKTVGKKQLGKKG